jgi:hypothetical protein
MATIGGAVDAGAGAASGVMAGFINFGCLHWNYRAILDRTRPAVAKPAMSGRRWRCGLQGRMLLFHSGAGAVGLVAGC